MPFTQDYLRHRFDYNEITGTLIRRYDPAMSPEWNHFAGARVGSTTRNRYRYSYLLIDGKRCLAHRIIWAWMTGDWPSEIDHIDHDGFNNAWSNLRASDRHSNAKNRVKNTNNQSGYKGVTFDKSTNRWRAVIASNHKDYHLGRFETLEAAHAAYCEASAKLHGTFGCTL